MERNMTFNASGPTYFHLEDLTETTIPGKLITIFTVVDVAMIFVILATIAVVKDRKINREVCFLFKLNTLYMLLKIIRFIYKFTALIGGLATIIFIQAWLKVCLIFLQDHNFHLKVSTLHSNCGSIFIWRSSLDELFFGVASA